MDELIQFIFKTASVLGLLYVLYSMFMSYKAKSWLSVTGHIDEKEIFITQADDSEWFKAKVHYHYKFNQINYKGKRIAFGLVSSTIENLVLKPYLEATASDPVTTVYVKPGNPNISTLLIGVRFFHWVQLTFFMILNFVVYFLLW